MSRSIKLAAIFVFGAAGLSLSQEPDLTQAPIRPVVDDYYGVKVEDPYRYFEDRGDPDLRRWSDAVSKVAEDHFSNLPGRKKIMSLLEQWDIQRGTSIRTLVRARGEILYLLMQRPEDEIPMVFRKAPHQKPELVIDPQNLMEGANGPVSVGYFSVSPDQQVLAMSLSAGGSENGTLYLVSIATGKTVDSPIPRCRWDNAEWLPDSSGFFYNQLNDIGPNGGRQQMFQRSRVFLHRLGTSSADDVAVFGIGVNPDISVAPEDLPFVRILPGSEWAVAMNETGVSNDYILHIARTADITNGSPKWRKISGRSDLIGAFSGAGIAIHGKHIYLLTRRDSPNGRVLRIDVSAPDLSHAETVFEPESGSIQDFAWAADGIYLKILDGGPSRLVRLPFAAVDLAQAIEIPQNSRIQFLSRLGVGSDLPGVMLAVQSWTQPVRYFTVGPCDLAASPLDLVEGVMPEICKHLVSRQFTVPGHDGTSIPVSLVYREGIELDGGNPVMLVGYGAYGITLEPGMWDSDTTIYEMGGIKAIAHVRGGGALGDAWRLAGYQRTKPNTWKDFIAVAKGLVKEGYTAPEHICASGRSAGGITVGRAIGDAPEAFGAAIIGVGVSDAVRMETTPNGVPNIPEFGSVKTERGFRSLYAMSPYHHIRDGVSYPATLIFHGLNDTRVEPWQSQKMAARLMAANQGGGPILLRMDDDAGHGGSSSRTQRLKLDADLISFFFANCR